MTNLLIFHNDELEWQWYPSKMAEPRHDWYLKQWLKSLGVTQSWVARQLNLQDSEISRKVSGTTPYKRDDVNVMARLLHLEPYELLMHPDDAMAIRRMRESAVRIASDQQMAAENRTAFKAQPQDFKRRIGE